MHWLQCHPRTYKVCRGTPHPNSNCSQEVSSPVHMPHAAGDAPSPLTCFSSFFVCQRVWLCPCLHLLLSAWSKSVMSAQGARGKEETRVTAIRKGKIPKWAVLCRFLPPSLPSARCPWSWDWKERRLLPFIHTAHRAALASLPVCTELLVPLANGERKRQRGRETRWW